MKLKNTDFKKQLEQYIQFRGIDIVLHLKDGSTVELDKNRRLEGDHVVRHNIQGVPVTVHLEEILKADFYAA